MFTAHCLIAGCLSLSIKKKNQNVPDRQLVQQTPPQHDTNGLSSPPSSQPFLPLPGSAWVEVSNVE